MPRTPPKAPALIAAAVLIAAPLTAHFEGERLTPYYDPAHILTVCDGETERQMRTYTHAECQAMLRQRQTLDYAPAVLKCAPTIKSPYVLAASTDAAYNAGVAAFCRSPMAARFNANDVAGGCNAFAGWYVTAKGKTMAGLVARRQSEKLLCLRGTA